MGALFPRGLTVFEGTANLVWVGGRNTIYEKVLRLDLGKSLTNRKSRHVKHKARAGNLGAGFPLENNLEITH
jgi:hypothetical protein